MKIGQLIAQNPDGRTALGKLLRSLPKDCKDWQRIRQKQQKHGRPAPKAGGTPAPNAGTRSAA